MLVGGLGMVHCARAPSESSWRAERTEGRSLKAAACESATAIEKDHLLGAVAEMGTTLRSQLEGLKSKYEFIKEIRGLGLMLAMELDRPGAPFVDSCREQGLLINCTQERVLRIMPAMTVTKRLIDQAVRILDRVLNEAGAAKEHVAKVSVA